MLDYEIVSYTVETLPIKNACGWQSQKFGTEEAAVEYIKEERHKWKDYKLIKTQVAVIDF